jgi:hypothetical protein
MDNIEISVMIGLDDLAHNRLYSMNLDTGESIPASNWGKRNPDEKCYCKELRKLGVRR